jgi:hypothetical protein
MSIETRHKIGWLFLCLAIIAIVAAFLVSGSTLPEPAPGQKEIRVGGMRFTVSSTIALWGGRLLFMVPAVTCGAAGLALLLRPARRQSP